MLIDIGSPILYPGEHFHHLVHVLFRQLLAGFILEVNGILL